MQNLYSVIEFQPLAKNKKNKTNARMEKPLLNTEVTHQKTFVGVILVD